MSRRLCFVHAPDPLHSAYQNFGNNYTPVWAFTLAAHVPEADGWELALHDTRLRPREQIPAADLFLLSGLNQDHEHLEQVRAHLRQAYPRARLVLGGPICWSFDQAGRLGELAGYDLVCVGDGELLLPAVLEWARGGQPASLERLGAAALLRRKDRFPMGGARPMHAPLLARHARDYYGAVVEVSRGCPFLCEFCDIRIMSDNNRTHDKPPEVVVADVDALYRLGVRAFMFACDNFIGDQRWAHEMVDALLRWKERTGFRPSIFTWLTINLYKDEELMVKMRRAGFDLVFIGVESFDQNSLLETAKVQNRAKELDLPRILRRIQSYGFVVTPGIIFGFDSDGPDLFELTIAGLEESALLTCNPSLLVALPGTPLHRRLGLAGRLRSAAHHIGRFKLQTNVRYLLPREHLTRGYLDFVRRVSDGRHQYRRFRAFLDNLDADQRYVPLEGEGYGNLLEFLRGTTRNPVARRVLLRRVSCFASRPGHLPWALLGALEVWRRRARVPDAPKYLQVWLYGWTNFLMQNWGLREEDIDLESVEGPLRAEQILPPEYARDVVEDIPASKTRAQLRATVSQLERLLSERLGLAAPARATLAAGP